MTTGDGRAVSHRRECPFCEGETKDLPHHLRKVCPVVNDA